MSDATLSSVPPPKRPEIWLRTNRRALLVVLLVSLLFVMAGASAVIVSSQFWFGPALAAIGWLTIAFAGIFSAMLLFQTTLPRLAYADGHLWVYLQSARPVAVPIEIVELFFAGQGVSHLPEAADLPSKSRTVVVRLAEAATEWHDRDVKPAWGEWREGYIIIRGTWCEPLTAEVLKNLNRRLREVHRERSIVSAAEASP